MPALALWLLVLIVAAALTVNVLQVFEDSLAQVVALALFIPLLIDTGGNCGSQASTSMVRAGRRRRAPRGRAACRLAGGPGGVDARVDARRGGLRPGGADLGTQPGPRRRCHARVDLHLGDDGGAALPFVARRLGIDPAVVSAPLITTLVGASGLLIYFGFANLILNI